MIVTLIYKDIINTLTLPEKIEGQFWIEVEEKKQLISIEGLDNKWIMTSNRKAQILNENKEKIREVELKENDMYTVKIGEEFASIFTEKLTEDRQTYTKLKIDKDIEISIGRNETNEICFKNNFVSSSHAILIYRNKYWIIKDNQSTNGVFINGRKEKATRIGISALVE